MNPPEPDALERLVRDIREHGVVITRRLLTDKAWLLTLRDGERTTDIVSAHLKRDDRVPHLREQWLAWGAA